VWTGVPWADGHFHGVARLDGADATLSENAAMEEGIARAVREFDKAKSFFRIEPLDYPLG
jgi:hypothetical protein